MLPAHTHTKAGVSLAGPRAEVLLSAALSNMAEDSIVDMMTLETSLQVGPSSTPGLPFCRAQRAVAIVPHRMIPILSLKDTLHAAAGQPAMSQLLVMQLEHIHSTVVVHQH